MPAAYTKPKKTSTFSDHSAILLLLSPASSSKWSFVPGSRIDYAITDNRDGNGSPAHTADLLIKGWLNYIIGLLDYRDSI